MALGFSAYQANLLLSSYTGTIFVKLHTAAPGAAGATAPAGNTTRKAVTFGSPSGGSAANTAAVNWTNVSTTETYTHISLWDALTGGNFLQSGTITAAGVTAAQDFTIPIGDITLGFALAS